MGRGVASRVVPPIVKVVTVKAAREQAFRRFTAEIASWWPLRTHSVGEDNSETILMEGWMGGRLVERIRDGREAIWGTVTVWQPPERVAFTWHPGEDPETAQHVEVRFIPAGDRTRVELEHRGFERLGPRGARIRRAYPLGWAYVLGLYAERRGPFMWVLGGVIEALMTLQRRRAAGQRAQPFDPSDV